MEYVRLVLLLMLYFERQYVCTNNNQHRKLCMWGINFIKTSTADIVLSFFAVVNTRYKLCPEMYLFPWSKVLTVWQWMWMLPLLKRMSMYTLYVDVYSSYIHCLFWCCLRHTLLERVLKLHHIELKWHTTQKSFSNVVLLEGVVSGKFLFITAT